MYIYIYCVSPNLPLQVSRVLCSNVKKILYARGNEICRAFPFQWLILAQMSQDPTLTISILARQAHLLI